MISFHLAVKNIISGALQSILIIIALASGVTLLVTTFLLTSAVDHSLRRNAERIDLVIGAKGSPLQLVLSSVYHVDIPNGNIEPSETEFIKQKLRIESAIPIVMGDNYRGLRIVGTIHGYLDLYGAKLDQGGLWHDDHQAVVGALTGLEIGDAFVGTHGFSITGNNVHTDQVYTVTGILKPTGTVIDRLILTSLESVNEAHAHHDHEAAENEQHGNHEEHSHKADGENAVVTAFLVQTRSPFDVMNLPRQINQNTHLMAASPSYEIARLTRSFGIGRDFVIFIGTAFVILSFFVMLSSLMIGLRQRQYDLALMRVLGASQDVILASVLLEAMILGALGSIAGIVIGHGLAYYAAMSIEQLSAFVLPATMLEIGIMDVMILGAGILIAALSALLPAMQASRDDITSILSKGKA